MTAGKYYLPYAEWAYKEGIISGLGNGRFAPEGAVTREEIALILQDYAKVTGYTLPVTRAEVAAILHRYVRLTIDPATAQGWTKNDGGRYMYYKDGKPLTGWQDIGSETSGKRYYFDVNAVMISGKWLRIDGKWYYFYKDGSLAKDTKTDSYEVDENGVRKTE